jgi:iron complex outermembrane recepter protein
MLTFKGTRISMLMAWVAASAIALPAIAQTTEMQEVIVTARKRDESYQDVPVTVNVFTAALVKDAGIYRPADFIQMVPNMSLVETQNAGNAFVVIRGISQARNSEPSVAVQVDGVLETNPAEFNQELYDIQQIEVLKGPQGALYGRNAIGGAIIVTTRPPADKFEASVKAGYGNENSVRGQLGVSGPISDTLAYRASVNYYRTDGFLNNVYLHEKADPVDDLSARARLVWKPNESFTGDLRVSIDDLSTKALYFDVPRVDEANPFGGYVNDANDVREPIQLDNPGVNNRDLVNTSLKLDFGVGGGGTVTSVSHYNSTEEILTGDAFDFRPAANSLFFPILGFDLNQSQYLDVTAYSQELRYTSPTDRKARWIAGAYYVHTDRFISTGNMVDDGTGVHAVYRQPRLSGNNPSFTYLADSQNNDAWALFADATFEIGDKTELDVAYRYDQDERRNTTDTPEAFLPAGTPPGSSGQVRTHTWSQGQPKFTLRYEPTDNMTIYGGWSRGFRSGGFNQTGVGAVADANGIAGVNDLFEAEVADTTEVGIKGNVLGGRMSLGATAFYTESTNGYFFVFLAANSTQNLGNLDARYRGFELEMNWHPTDAIDLYASYGYTRSTITDMEDESVVGNRAPLASQMTGNAGAQYTVPVGELNLSFRLDYRHTGRTWWDPYNVTSRDPIDLLDARIGLAGQRWNATLWGKNITDEKYNQEFSPGGFLFKALPIRYGVEFEYKF